MFGFSSLLDDRIFGNLLSGKPLFSNEVLNDLFAFDKNTEISDATLLNTHQFTEGSLTYEQKVYRLKDNSIFVETKTVHDTELESLQKNLSIAIENQNFEEAAILRDKINSLKTN